MLMAAGAFFVKRSHAAAHWVAGRTSVPFWALATRSASANHRLLDALVLGAVHKGQVTAHRPSRAARHVAEGDRGRHIRAGVSLAAVGMAAVDRVLATVYSRLPLPKVVPLTVWAPGL